MSVIKVLLINAAIIGAIAIIVGAVLGFKVLPDFVDDKVASSVQLGYSDQYRRWKQLPFPLQFKVYVFNVTNPNEVLINEKPIVNQIGPYVYNQFRIKENIEYDEDTDTYSYSERQLYEFNQEASGSLKETDEVTIFNVAKYGVILTAEDEDMPATANSGLNKAFPDTVDHLFHKIQVKEYFFNGYKFCIPDEMTGITGFAARLLCLNIKGKIPYMNTMQINEDNSFSFSFFNFKNDTTDGVYVINSGMIDAKKTGQIQSHEGKKYLDVWNDVNSTCNVIKGTDSKVFPPYNDKDSEFNVYSTDICRTVTLKYSDEMEYKDIDGYRSTLGSDAFASGTTHEKNQCYCVKQLRNLEGNKECFPDGFVDMYTCLHSPVVLSYPHLLWADKTYSETVVGLKPDESKHATFVDMEPKTGSPLRGGKRIQFNQFLRQITSVIPTNNVLSSVIPILWIDEGMELPDDLVQHIKDEYLSKLPMVDGVKWGLIVIGIVLMVCSAGYFIYLSKKTVKHVE